MRHPAESVIALYAGGDLGFLEKLRVGHHLRGCSRCRSEVSRHRAASELLRAEASELPAGLNWDRLAAEMTGNIRVGLAAGECVGELKSSRTHGFAWKPVAAICALSLVVTSAWWLNFPVEQRETLVHNVSRIWNRTPAHLPADRVFLEANRAGIQVKENGSAFTMMHPDATPTVISVSTQGTIGARYIADTGQVTITNVYGQ